MVLAEGICSREHVDECLSSVPTPDTLTETDIEAATGDGRGHRLDRRPGQGS